MDREIYGFAHGHPPGDRVPGDRPEQEVGDGIAHEGALADELEDREFRLTPVARGVPGRRDELVRPGDRYRVLHGPQVDCAAEVRLDDGIHRHGAGGGPDGQDGTQRHGGNGRIPGVTGRSRSRDHHALSVRSVQHADQPRIEIVVEDDVGRRSGGQGQQGQQCEEVLHRIPSGE